MTSQIKITQLSDIGNGLTNTTLVPVVNMAGVPSTQKATVGNIANSILAGAGTTYQNAGVANIAFSVANAAQPNITSVGTLSVNTLKITGGTAGQVLSTDGAGNLSFTTVSGGGGTPGGANTQVQYNDAGNFGGDADFTYDAGNNILNVIRANVSYLTAYNSIIGDSLTVEQDVSGNGALRLQGIAGGNSTINIGGEADIDVVANIGNINLYTASNQPWIFDQDGNLTLPGNTFAVNYANGTQVSIGGGSGNTGDVTFSNNIVIGTGDEYGYNGLYLAPGTNSTANLQYLRVRGGDYPTHIHLDTGNNEYYDQYFGADSRYVKLEANGNVVINADDYAGNGATWNFDTDGNLTLPNDANIATIGNVTQFNTCTNGFLSLNSYDAGGNNIASLALNSIDGLVGISTYDPATDSDYHWAFNNNGGTIFPTLDTPYGDQPTGNETGPTLRIGDGLNDGIISTPDGTVDNSYTNIVLQPGQGYDDSRGGKTIIRGGRGGPTAGSGGGDVRIFGGYGTGGGSGGDIELYPGNSANADNAGAVRIVGTNYSQLWQFNNNGNIIFPTLTVDLHNGGNQTAQTLQFGDTNQQAIITGPTPETNNNAQRLIIQGQRGNGAGEGGDVYVWAGDADTNGGDIKIYAGDADVSGYGGYINIEGGQGVNGGGALLLTGGQSADGQGGEITITPGYSGNSNGATLSLNGGQAAGNGGGVNITAGAGTANGGQVTITGGQSALGLANYGNVLIQAGASTWTFDNNGNLTLPDTPGVSINYANGQPYGTGGGLSGIVVQDEGTNVVASANTINFVGNGVTASNVGGVATVTISGNSSQIANGNSNVSVPNASDNVYITTNNGTSKQWIFNTNGSLRTPGNVDIYGAINFPQQVSNINWATYNIELSQYGRITTNVDFFANANTIGAQYLKGDGSNITNISVTKIANGTSNVNIPTSNGNVVITANGTANWTFDADGNLTASGNLVIAGNTNVFGTYSALIQPTDDKPLLSISSGANGAVSSVWVEDIGNVGTSNIAAVYANPTVGSGIVRIAVGQNSGNAGPNLWDFNSNGTTAFPGDLIGSGASPAPSINGFDSANFAGNITAANLGNISSINLDGNVSNVLSGLGTWIAAGSGSVAEASFSIQTADFNANVGSRYGVDTTGGAVTATLPASPATGAAVFFADAGGAYASNNLTINPNGGTIMGASGNMTVSTNNQSFGLFFNGATWRTYN